jgi:transmembrane sensor
LIMSAYLFMQLGNERVRMVEVRTNPGVVSRFELPDGTKVWLNAGSTLNYPQKFRAENRQVELTGQGYFEVTKNPEKPFIVKTTYLAVQALGTLFTVVSSLFGRGVGDDV